MATQEKLQKSLEILKNLSHPGHRADSSKRKEKIQHCYIITEAISNPTIKISTNFQVLLGITIEALLKLCDDPDSDIVLTSEECLNRIIRSVNDENISKVPIELHKEIKKNGPSRSLRAALWRFSQLAHHIRPHKGKPYVVHMFPSLIKIAERSEEQVHETLAFCLPKIMKVLGCFAPDSEVKALLRAFLSNISNMSPVIRRTSSNCILNICLHSKKPYVFIVYCLNHLTDLLLPVSENQSNSTVLGVMTCCKLLLPHLQKSHSVSTVVGNNKEVDLAIPANKLLQLYELCLHYLTSKDHNIVNASLETLNTLCLHLPSNIKKQLLSKYGLDKSRIYHTHSMMNIRSPSQLSIATNVTSNEENLFADYELTETSHSDIEKWIGQSKLSVMNMAVAKPTEKSESLDTLNNFPISDVCDYGNTDNYEAQIKGINLGDNLDNITISDNSSEKSFSCSADDKLSDNEAPEIDPGDFMERDVSLLYCIRLITKLFLLSGIPGNYTSDKISRVSVKSTALACLTTIFEIYPEGFLKYVDRNYEYSLGSKISQKISSQKISDIILFSNHTDPQLRGAVRGLLCSFITSVLRISGNNYEKWLTENARPEDRGIFEMKRLVNILVKGLEDESSNCSKQTLISLNPTLYRLAESDCSVTIIPILHTLPLLASNPYWLVKVSLCELLSNLCYVTINYISGNSDFQKKVLYNVLFELLKDKDQRVRTASASTIVTIIPNLYFEDYRTKEDALATKAVQLSDKYLSNIGDPHVDINFNKKHFIKSMPFPLSKIADCACDRVEYSLSKIIRKLYFFVLSSSSKYFVYGCIESLNLLSQKYPCTVYVNSWNFPLLESKDDHGTTEIPDLFSLCISFLSGSVHIYDLRFQSNVLSLTSSLFSGYALSIMRPIPGIENSTKLWEFFPNPSFCNLCSEYLSHTIKLLSIFHHVINDIASINHSKTVLPHLPSTSAMSPIKRRKSELDKKMLNSVNKSLEKDDKKETKANSISTFSHLPHYLKIHDILKSSFVNYKISLESNASENFFELLKSTLHSLSVIMEISTLNEFGKMAEDILSYLRSIFALEPTLTVTCVQQLLKCLFGTNLISNISEMHEETRKKYTETQIDSFGLYYNLYQKPYNDFAKCVSSLNQIKIESDGDSTIMGYLHRKDVKKPSTLSKSSEAILANYIRIFEPMVIKSLKQYTITTDVKLQCKVLGLLSQLVQLRVNYCLLDSDQVFIGFVLKQFEYIEEGQIPYSEELIPKIFQFLVQLSYSKQHSKFIISIPKIIHLCDGLMACGHDPLTHCIPALEPIVEDIFLTRNTSNTTDLKELETTREVVLSMLLRLAEYKEVLDLISLILEDSKYCVVNTEKWLKWSKQVISVVLPLLKQNKIKIDDSEAFLSLRRFIFSLNPLVFENLDEIIVMLFQEVPDLENEIILNRWLAKITILLVIVTPVKEEVLLSRMNHIKGDFCPNSIFENAEVTADPLNVHNNANVFQACSSEEIFIRFLFRSISLALARCSETKQNYFFIKQISLLLMYCIYIFQSGCHGNIANKASEIIKKNDFAQELNITNLNSNFMNLTVSYPTLSFLWCYLVTLLNYCNKQFWQQILYSNIQSECINSELVASAGAITICDYFNDNVGEKDILQWFLSNNSRKLVNLVEETPVFELISSMHRNPEYCSFFLKHVSQNCLDVDSPIFTTKLLKCIENAHSSKVGMLLHILIPRMLNYRQTALSRSAAHLASRKVEFLLTLPMEDVNSQLSKDDILQIKKNLVTSNSFTKHEALVSLLNKLLIQYYDLSPMQLDQRKIVNPEYVQKLQINKKWYLSQIEAKYDDSNIALETAQLLNNLELGETSSFMKNDNFNRLCLKQCLKLGTKNIRERNLKQIPAVVEASVNCLLQDIINICNGIPSPHQVHNPIDRQQTSSETKYASEAATVFGDKYFSQLIIHVAPSVSSLLNSLPLLPNYKLSDNNLAYILKFAVLSLEFVDYVTQVDKSIDINILDILLSSASSVFTQSSMSSLLNLDVNMTWLCSAVNSIFKLVRYLLLNNEPLPSIPKYILKDSLECQSTMPAALACHQIYTLVCWLQNKIKKSSIPKFLLKPVKSIIVALSRISPVNSYVLIPMKVWKSGWQPSLSGTFKTQVPPIPIEFLQDVEILEDYIYRITLLGWTSRQQFEETWMCLLSVLCSPVDNLVAEDINDIAHATSLAIKAITTLLLQTLQYPVVGNSNISKIVHVSRNSPIKMTSKSIQKLHMIQTRLKWEFSQASEIHKNQQVLSVFDPINFEKNTDKYSYGQISIKYLLIATNIIEECNENSFVVDAYRQQTKILEDSGLDINSCLQFLLDYYTQLLKPESNAHLRVLHDAIRSIVIISDLFVDKSQFSWMLEFFLELSKIHATENELLHKYLMVGICKSIAVLNPDLEVYETVKKLLMQYLKGPYLSTRLTCLHGILYILEGCKLNNIIIGGISDEMHLILPCAVEYIQTHLNTTNSVLRKSQEHMTLVWSLAFYLIENVDEVYLEQNFVISTLNVAFSTLQTKSVNYMHKAIIKGIERLVIVKREYILEKVGKQILKLAFNKIRDDNPAISFFGIQLLLTYMYNDCAEYFDNTKNTNVQTNPEHLVQTIEKISAIFDYIKKGYVTQVEVLCSVLPDILKDFFSPSDILTKVIGEFLSPHQPHPKLLSRVVFQVFECAIEQNQLPLLQDWVVFSLSNFTQSFSLGMATWCLTCFFISASSNEWLRSYFPYVQTRVGRYEYEDKKMFCIAGRDFYKNLTNDKQRQTFVDNFMKVKDQSDMPFGYLLSSL